MTARERYWLLIRQLYDELGTKTAVAEKLGIADASGIRGGKTAVGLDKVEAAIHSLPIRPEYFFDPTLEAPDYRRFLGPVVGMRTHPVIEDFIQAHGLQNSHAASLRRLPLAFGDNEITNELLLGVLRGLSARDAVRALNEPVESPDGSHVRQKN